MFGSNHSRQALFGTVAVAILFVLILAACTSSIQLITPAPEPETSLPSEASPAVEPEVETPVPEAESSEVAVDEPATEATAEAIEEPVDEPTAEAAEEPVDEPTAEAVEAAVEEAAAEEAVAEEATDETTDETVVAEASNNMPAPITHALARREDCTACHEVGIDLPEDHENLTDDLCLYCHMPEEGEAAIPPLPEKAEPEFCLACHGPHEELMARTEDYVTENGLSGNPHMYTPHDSTNIVPCRSCHEVHDLPVTEPEAIEQADLQYCFAACHHEQTFEPCNACH